MTNRPAVYLAGKVTGHDWRYLIVPDLKWAVCNGWYELNSWEPIRDGIEGFGIYSGPFPMKLGKDSRHGWMWGDPKHRQHGIKAVNLDSCGHGHCGCEDDTAIRDHVARECRLAIYRSSHLFAYIETADAFGSILEIGFAIANGIRVEVWYASDALAEQLWLASEWAFRSNVAPTAEAAWLQSWTRGEVIAEKAKHALASLSESPIETALANAILSKPWGAKLKAQHIIGHYRADLALLDYRIVIECDGHAYHSTKDQRGRDAKRDRFLTAQGWRVVRCTGTEIHADVSKVVADIEAVVNSGAGA